MKEINESKQSVSRSGNLSCGLFLPPKYLEFQLSRAGQFIIE